jgi:hypothetical protein
MHSDSQPLTQMTATPAQRIFISWTKDVLIYILVLNLFVEYHKAIVIDSFTISIFTAILLKVLLDIILGLEHKVAEFFESRAGASAKFLRILFTWLILFLSKFAILEVVDFVFGEHVELGKFLSVLTLVITLMVAREIVQRIYVSLGNNAPAAPESA